MRMALAVIAVTAMPLAAAAFTPDELQERAVVRRAVEAANWGMPVVNFDRMLQAFKDQGGNFNQIVYWGGLFDWKNQTLTPNPDTIYFKPFWDTKTVGPMVVEIPPAGPAGSITGTLMDVWQAALEDVGPAGVDAGKGGKYLILPPGYAQTPPDGYIVLPSSTYEGFALLRSTITGTGQEAVKRAVDYGRKVRLYPLSEAASPHETKFVDVLGKVFDSTIRYDLSFFRSLDRVIQYEPWLPRDKAMIDMLKTVGIEKGKPFAPNAAEGSLLEGALAEARAWIDLRYDTKFEPYFEGKHWALPASPDLVKVAATFYESADSYAVDARGVTDYWAFSTVKHLGAGQFYLMSTKDSEGNPLDGSKSYSLAIPADVPVGQYWSAVVYDRQTHALIRDVESPGKSSQSQGLKADDDGSVTLTFGHSTPAGKDANWTPTKPDGRFEVLFRFYAPKKPLFDKTWVLPDIELVK